MNTFLEQIGNFNPQILRELRGKLKMRSVAVAIAIPIAFQFLLLLFQSQRLPSELCQTPFRCASSWAVWWQDQFRTLLYAIPYSLFFLGTFSLIADLTQENSKGTLNFIRLSPRSSLTIFLGKLIGVPILCYLGVLLLVPLHIISGLAGGVAIGFFISYYLLLIAFAFFIFSLAIAFSLVGFAEQKQIGIQAYGGAIFFSFITLIFFSPLFILWNANTTWLGWQNFLFVSQSVDRGIVEWWYLPLSGNIIIAHCFTLGNIGLISYLIWQILRRRFYNPNATVLSKGFSYFASAYLEVLILGFLQRADLINNTRIYNIQTFFLYIINFFLIAGLTFVLTPKRQSVMEWARYGRGANTILDLIWYDKSPSILAIAINLLITQSLVIGTIVFSANPNKVGSVLVVFLLIVQWLFYALILQNILLAKIKNPLTWGIGTILTLTFFPAIVMGILGFTSKNASILWLVLGSIWSSYAFLDASVNDFIASCLILGICAGVAVSILIGKIRAMQTAVSTN